ncbi:MAG: hypothetical protein WC100_00900 [Sterolibacterium sp.]
MVDFAAHMARLIARAGQPVTVTPSTGPAREIIAVFAAAPAESLGMSGFGPSLHAMSADVSDLVAGNAVTVGGSHYTVANVPAADPVSGDITLPLEAV